MSIYPLYPDPQEREQEERKQDAITERKENERIEEEIKNNYMTELKLYQWIEDNNIEYHWETNNGKDDVIIFPLCCQVQSFNEMFSASIFSDSGIACIMKNGYFAFWMNDICEYYGLEIENIFPKEKVRIPN